MAQLPQAGTTPAVPPGNPYDREPGFSVLRQMLETFPLPQYRLRDELGWQQCTRRKLDATTREDLQMEMLTPFFLLGTKHKWKGKEIGFVGNKTFYQIPLWLYCNKRYCGYGSKNWCQKTGTTVKYVTPHDTNGLPSEIKIIHPWIPCLWAP